METIKASDMRLGDRVVPIELASVFSACVVKAITEKFVHLYRPYGTSPSTISYGFTENHYTPYEAKGLSVICLTGVEEYAINKTDPRDWMVERAIPEVK